MGRRLLCLAGQAENTEPAASAATAPVQSSSATRQTRIIWILTIHHSSWARVYWWGTGFWGGRTAVHWLRDNIVGRIRRRRDETRRQGIRKVLNSVSSLSADGRTDGWAWVSSHLTPQRWWDEFLWWLEWKVLFDHQQQHHYHHSNGKLLLIDADGDKISMLTTGSINKTTGDEARYRPKKRKKEVIEEATLNEWNRLQAQRMDRRLRCYQGIDKSHLPDCHSLSSPPLDKWIISCVNLPQPYCVVWLLSRQITSTHRLFLEDG